MLSARRQPSAQPFTNVRALTRSGSTGAIGKRRSSGAPCLADSAFIRVTDATGGAGMKQSLPALGHNKDTKGASLPLDSASTRPGSAVPGKPPSPTLRAAAESLVSTLPKKSLPSVKRKRPPALGDIGEAKDKVPEETRLRCATAPPLGIDVCKSVGTSPEVAKRPSSATAAGKPQEVPPDLAHASSLLGIGVGGMGKRISRHVWFCDGGLQFHTAFTPYGKKYGVRPEEFFFDADGSMVLCTSPTASKRLPLLDVDEENTVECISTCGVGYRSIPELPARFADHRTVELGDRVVVVERCGAWIKDSVGWLPLQMRGRDLFEIVGAKREKKVCTPRVAVMIRADSMPSLS